MIPSENDIEVRVYPSAWGWFGFSLDKKLIRTACSDSENAGCCGSKNIWSYPNLPDDMMDYAYDERVKAATEIVAVFAPKGCPIPQLRITGDSLGTWKKLDFTVEWGFDEALPAFTGKTLTHMAYISEPLINPENKTARFTCLYSDVSRYGCDSKFTCITDEDDLLGATILLRDLAKGPICIPEAGLFFCPADTPMTAAEYISAQQEQHKKSVRQQVREHKEVSDWEELIRNARLWRCPDGTQLPPFPEAPAASVTLRVPDKRWEGMYEHAVEQLRGHHVWGMLAAEVARSTLASELMGLYEEADRIYDYFLASPGIKADGDFSSGEGSLEWAKSMRHDIGYSHEGTHFSTGKLLFSMMHRYYLTGDTAWLAARLPRLKKAADWIIKELKSYMEDTPNRADLHSFGLMPPSMLGDYALPASDWRWYYYDNAFTLMGLSAFADVLTRIGDPDAAHYTQASEQYKADLLAAVTEEREKYLKIFRFLHSGESKPTSNAPVEDLWFWNSFSNLPKISHNANIYLRQDDIPNFLHFFFTHAIMMVGSNGKLWEHAHSSSYDICDNPDNGTAAWFTENFRNMLLTEDNGILWLMKGTPRAWLEQDKVIEAVKAPTWYGPLTYRTVSDVSNGRIHSVIDVPSRSAVPVLKLRLRHPKAATISSVLVNGIPYDNIDADGETITFENPQERLEITAIYA